MALVKFLSKLFGDKPSIDFENLYAEKSAFRAKVIQAAQDIGSQSELILDENDPLVFHFLVGDEAKGYGDLNNTFNHLKAYPEEDENEYIQQFARIILNEDSMPAEVLEENVVVVIRPDEYITNVKGRNVDIMEQHLCGDLHCFYMVDMPDAMRGLDASDLPHLTKEDVHSLALKNVGKSFSQMNSDASLEGVTLYYVEGNSFLTSSLILLDEFWEHVERSYGTDFVFALPRKDQLFVFDAKHPQHVDFARQMIKVTFEDDFNLLSTQIFKRTDGKIERVE